MVAAAMDVHSTHSMYDLTATGLITDRNFKLLQCISYSAKARDNKHENYKKMSMDSQHQPIFNQAKAYFVHQVIEQFIHLRCTE